MTREQFKSLWATRYSKTIPISHFFRHDYSNRWFRIHSLPESKRYPENDAEWRILLSRQNSIITDILGDNSKIVMVTGKYYQEGQGDLDSINDFNPMKQFAFVQMADIDLHKLRPKEHEQGEMYRPMFCESVWIRDDHDTLLRDIAKDSVRIFFVALKHDTVAAPYDGGIDFILKDSEMRDKYKNKYRDWLSERKDGL
jgi:hypothetical protein